MDILYTCMHTYRVITLLIRVITPFFACWGPFCRFPFVGFAGNPALLTWKFPGLGSQNQKRVGIPRWFGINCWALFRNWWYKLHRWVVSIRVYWYIYILYIYRFEVLIVQWISQHIYIHICIHVHVHIIFYILATHNLQHVLLRNSSKHDICSGFPPKCGSSFCGSTKVPNWCAEWEHRRFAVQNFKNRRAASPLKILTIETCFLILP